MLLKPRKGHHESNKRALGALWEAFYESILQSKSRSRSDTSIFQNLCSRLDGSIDVEVQRGLKSVSESLLHRSRRPLLSREVAWKAVAVGRHDPPTPRRDWPEEPPLVPDRVPARWSPGTCWFQDTRATPEGAATGGAATSAMRIGVPAPAGTTSQEGEGQRPAAGLVDGQRARPHAGGHPRLLGLAVERAISDEDLRLPASLR